MDELSSTTGIGALVAGGLALIALMWAIAVTIQLRRLRGAQSAVLGQHGQRDVSARLDSRVAASLRQREPGLRRRGAVEA